MERIDRPHPAQDHGGVKKRIDPAQTSNVMIPDYANAQSDANQKKREQQTASDALGEFRAT
jgi:hypothetical protein